MLHLPLRASNSHSAQWAPYCNASGKGAALSFAQNVSVGKEPRTCNGEIVSHCAMGLACAVHLVSVVEVKVVVAVLQGIVALRRIPRHFDPNKTKV